MTILEKNFSEYLEEQREKFGIRDCHFRRISDMVQTACVYSRLDGEGTAAPDYYMTVYCVGLFVKYFLPEETTVHVFEETSEAKKRFGEAYRELREGKSMRDAVSKMRAALDAGSMEALYIYQNILSLTGCANMGDEMGYCRKKENEWGISAADSDAAGLVAGCFAGSIRALMSLSELLNPGSAKCPEIRKSRKLSELLCNWAVAMLEKKAISGKGDTYAMIELYSYYDSLKNRTYAGYWLQEALNRGYHVAKYIMARDICVKGFYSYLEGGNSEGDAYSALDRAIAYLNEIKDIGYEDARDNIQACKKLKKQMESSARAQQAREYRERAQAVEQNMKAYRQKLDRRERVLNYITDDVILTDREAGDFFMIMRDYESAVDYYARGSLRERREQDYFKKQMKKLEDEAWLRRQEEASSRSFGAEEASPVDYRKFQQAALRGEASLLFPPADKTELQNEEFVRLYADCNAYRQMNNFESAAAEAEKLLTLFPESCMAHWMHFLAANGIVFEESFEVYNICRMINDSYLYDEDYQWIMEHSGEEDRKIFERYFSDFEARRMEYMAEQENAALYKIVFCYCGRGEDGKKSLSASIAEKIIMRWEENHSPQYPIHCYSSDFYKDTFTEIFEEARTYGALKNADIMVIIAEKEDEFFSDEMWNQWKRYYDWSLYNPDKQIIAVSTGQLSQTYRGITDSVMEIHGEEDIDRLYQALADKCWGLDAYLGDLYIPPEGTTQNITELIRDCLSARDVDYGIKTQSGFLSNVNIFGLRDPKDSPLSGTSQSVIEMEAYCQIAFNVRLRKPMKENTHVIYSLKMYDSGNRLIAEHSWDFGKDNADMDSFAGRWSLRDSNNGQLIFAPGIYRARVQINDEEPLDGFFMLTYKAGRDERFDKMARDMNLVPAGEERRMPWDQMRERMRSRARERYLSRAERYNPLDYTGKSYAEETVVKGIFKKKTVYGHSAEIGDDGTVHVTTCNETNHKDLPYAFGEESIAQEIARMKDIVEVACISRGILALDARGDLHYAGRDGKLQEEARRLGPVKSVVRGKDGFYILTLGGQLLELGPDGVKVKEEGVKAVSTRTYLNNSENVSLIYIDANGTFHSGEKSTADTYQSFIAFRSYGNMSICLSESGQLYIYFNDITVRWQMEKGEENRKTMLRMKGAYGIIWYKRLDTYTIEAHFCNGRTEKFAFVS